MEEVINSSVIGASVADPALVQDGSEPDKELSVEITNLWTAHGHAQSAANRSKEELQEIRLKLGRRLAEIKALVSRPGCGGGWSAFLEAHGIPRATGDRLVGRFKKTLEPQGNRLSESISEPTDGAVLKLFEAVWPKLKKVLATDASVIQFIIYILTASGVAHQKSEEGLLIFNPPPMAVAELPGSACGIDPDSQASDDGGDANTGEAVGEAVVGTAAIEQGTGDDV